MPTLDLSKPFTALVMERDAERPDLRLESTLNKVGTTLMGYADGLGKTKDELTLLEICLSNEVLHPALERCPTVLIQEKGYRGQNLSRIRKLVKGLAWGDDEADGNNLIAVEEQLPEHLREIRHLFSRVLGRRISREASEDERKAYYEYRKTLPLSEVGRSLALSLLRVSTKLGVNDNRRLFEECRESIYEDVMSHNPPNRWESLKTSFCALRGAVREYLGYQVEIPSRIILRLEELPEPLRTQVLTYKRRALEGFGEDVDIKIIARKNYKLKLGKLAPETVRSLVTSLLLGLGYIPREAYGDRLDIKDLLRLQAGEVVIEGEIEIKLYNPLVEIYRTRELRRTSVYKEEGYDSVAFCLFLNAITGVAAYNGFLRQRKKFLQEYSVTNDIDSKDKLRERKKEVFNLDWLDGQIEMLGVEFYRIAESGSFKYSTDGSLSKRARRDLNLCMFYVILVTLRFIGVRQECLRDCVICENIKFGTKSLTFEWKSEEVKNGKGIKHSLNMEDHDLVQGTLIDAVLTYYNKIYKHITGGDKSLPQEFRAAQREGTAGQFFFEVGRKTCHPFKNESKFAWWFHIKAHIYLDLKGKLGEKGVRLHPHLLRALYGDWLKDYLGFSKEQTAAMAGDETETFRRNYLRRQGVYDATPAWTTKNRELKARREAVKVRGKAAGVDE